MRFYGARWHDDEPTAGNVEWFTAKRDAERVANENGGFVEVLDLTPTKAGLLDFLDRNVWRRP